LGEAGTAGKFFRSKQNNQAERVATKVTDKREEVQKAGEAKGRYPNTSQLWKNNGQ